MEKNHNGLEDLDKPFLMSIDEDFVIEGRKTIFAFGKVLSGTAAQGDSVEIGFPASGNPPIKTIITDFEGFFSGTPKGFRATPGDRLGVMLVDLSTDQINPGMVISAPGSIDFSSP